MTSRHRAASKRTPSTSRRRAACRVSRISRSVASLLASRAGKASRSRRKGEVRLGRRGSEIAVDDRRTRATREHRSPSLFPHEMRSCYRGISRVYGRRNAISGHSFGEGRRAGRSLLYIVGLGWLDGLEDAPGPRRIIRNLLINQGKMACCSTVTHVERPLQIADAGASQLGDSGRS